MGLSSARAFAKASSPHGYQSTGLCACCSRYGLVSRASRFSLTDRSALEGQVADSGRHDALADTHADRRAGLGVLASHHAERQRAAEAERARGTGHRPDRRVVGDDLAAGGWHRITLEDQAAQMTVDVTAVANAHDDFLAGIAA